MSKKSIGGFMKDKARLHRLTLLRAEEYQMYDLLQSIPSHLVVNEQHIADLAGYSLKQCQRILKSLAEKYEVNRMIMTPKAFDKSDMPKWKGVLECIETDKNVQEDEEFVERPCTSKSGSKDSLKLRNKLLNIGEK